MAHLPLSQGYVALVDDHDLPELRKSRWAYKEGYAVRTVKVGPNKYRKQYLQQALIQVPPGHQILFKNHNGLDCRRENLMLVTILEARRAARPRKNATSRCKGVARLKASGLFKAEIVVEGRVHYLGAYPDEETAAHVYDNAVRHHFGPIGYLNFPDKPAPATDQSNPDGRAATQQPSRPVPAQGPDRQNPSGENGSRAAGDEVGKSGLRMNPDRYQQRPEGDSRHSRSRP